MPQPDEGGTKSLLQALIELSGEGAFEDLHRAYEQFLEDNRPPVLSEEDHALLVARDWPEIYRRARAEEREENILCIIC